MPATSVGLEYVNGDSVDLSPGDPVALRDGGRVWRARADSQAKSVVFGVVMVGGSPTNKVTVIQVGMVWFDGAALTPGAFYYLGVTGGLTTSPPSLPGHSVVEVGIATDSHGLHVFPRGPFLL